MLSLAILFCLGPPNSRGEELVIIGFLTFHYALACLYACTRALSCSGLRREGLRSFDASIARVRGMERASYARLRRDSKIEVPLRIRSPGDLRNGGACYNRHRLTSIF